MSENLTLSWDDEIDEGQEFKIVPDGDYEFEVSNFERGYYEAKAGSKIPSCDQAEYELSVEWKDEDGEIRTNKLTLRLKLTKKLQWLIYEFFESVGLIEKGSGPKKMPWKEAVGCRGICRVGHHDANGKSFNDVVKCYPVGLAPKVVANKGVSDEFMQIPEGAEELPWN